MENIAIVSEMNRIEKIFEAINNDKFLERIMLERQFIVDHKKKFRSLTPRETEILKLVCKGYNNPKISSELYISRRTVEQHRKNINRKLEPDSLIHLFRYGQAFDLIQF